MAKTKEIVYMILDELKGYSDDFSFTEDHIIFLLDGYRALLLKKEYLSGKKKVPLSNYKTICLNLEKSSTICGEDKGSYLRSIESIPDTMDIGTSKIHPCSFFTGDINMVSMDRLRYSGEGRFASESIYGTIGPDKHLYLKSSNPQFLYLEKVQITAVFESSSIGECNPLEEEYPIETAYISLLIESVVRELTNSIYKPEDASNNGRDDFSKLQLGNKNKKNEKDRE